MCYPIDSTARITGFGVSWQELGSALILQSGTERVVEGCVELTLGLMQRDRYRFYDEPYNSSLKLIPGKWINTTQQRS